MAAKEKTRVIVVRNAKRAAMATHAAGGTYIIAGALVMLIANSEFVRNHPWVKATWWLVPIGLLVAGLIARRKGSKYAPALLVAGAMLLVQAWQSRPTTTTAGTKPAGDTKGPSEFNANGARIRLNPDGTIEVVGGDTGAPANDSSVRNMADAVYGRRAAA